MKFIHRLGYYLGGFSIGLVFLAFFLNGKNVSCNYGPEARVLKNISTKKHIYSSDIYNFMSNNAIDSIEVANIIRNGSVNFSESQTQLDSCKVYIIEGEYNAKEYRISLENCDSIARINNIKMQ